MANKKSIAFSLRVTCDGTSTTVTCDFTTGPFEVGSAGGSVSTAFSLAVTNPTALNSLTADSGISVTAVIGLLGVVTFTYASAPAAGLDVIHGTFAF